MQSMDPDTLIVLGEMQKIWSFFSRFWAYSLPTVIAAGKAGGTTIVIKSKASTNISTAGIPRITCKF